MLAVRGEARFVMEEWSNAYETLSVDS
jgi:hypothetical protein